MLLFMIFALVHFHLYGLLILFCGKHKEFGKHSFKYKQGKESLKISNAFKIFSAYLLSLVLNVLSNIKTWACSTTSPVGAQCLPRQSYMYSFSLEGKVIHTGACRNESQLALVQVSNLEKYK